jgi:hypothetical protein
MFTTLVMLASPGTPPLDVYITLPIFIKESFSREFLGLPYVQVIRHLSTLQLRNDTTHEVRYPGGYVAIVKHDLIGSAFRTNVMLEH